VWGGTAFTLAIAGGLLAIFWTGRQKGVPAEKEATVAFLRWLLCGLFGLMAILWLFYDRYALPLLPVSIVLVLASCPIKHPQIALVLLAIFGVVALTGARDHLRYNDALWNAVRRARELGVPDADVDGGYVVNGWLQYAHPDNAPRDAEGRVAVAWLNASASNAHYRIANRPFDGWRMLAAIPYDRWWGRAGRVYVLAATNPR
jgi:hypothetical protein